MKKRLNIRTTKFPYFFWGFNKAYQCELDFKTRIYKNLETNTSYAFEPLNVYIFLLLKYFPLLIIFYFTFSIWDFAFNKFTLSAYILALFLVCVVNFLENLARKVGVVILVAITLGLSFLIKDYFLLAYVFKYFLLLSVCVIFYLDLRLKPFCLLKESRVVSGFCLDKKSCLENGKGNKQVIKAKESLKEFFKFKTKEER